jgi:hypothetical protein
VANNFSLTTNKVVTTFTGYCLPLKSPIYHTDSTITAIVNTLNVVMEEGSFNNFAPNKVDGSGFSPLVITMAVLDCIEVETDLDFIQAMQNWKFTLRDSSKEFGQSEASTHD